MKYYFTLVVRTPGQLWTLEFGDYDRNVVTQEVDDTRANWPKGTKMKVIRTGGKQSDISAAVDRLNETVKS